MSSSRSHKEEKEDLQMQQVPSHAEPLPGETVGPQERVILLTPVPTRGQGEELEGIGAGKRGTNRSKSLHHPKPSRATKK